jgi:hypothetical protein
MVAVAFLLIWSGYGLADFGWCLFKDYDITLGQLLSPLHPYSGAWPPPSIPSTQIWPSSSAAAAASSSASSASATPPSGVTGDILHDLTIWPELKKLF